MNERCARPAMACTARLARWAANCLTDVAGERLGYHPPFPDTPTDVIRALFERRVYPRGWFTDELRSTLRRARLSWLISGMTERFGLLRDVRYSGAGYVAELERGFVPVAMMTDADGRLARLRLSAPSPRFHNLEDATAAFRALPERLSLLVTRNRERVLAIEPDRAMAVGSACKLAILKVLADEVASGTAAWTDLVSLEPGWRALPSGMLQNWPVDVQLTVETLACLMISMSDNTAATALLERVGREAVEAVAPDCRPFLSPREFFILKSVGADDVRRRYIAAGVEERRRILATLRNADVPPARELLSIADRDIEWLFSAEQLCRLMDDVASLPAVRINSGPINKDDWQSLAFKSGSDIGVLSLTTRLEALNGTHWCISAIWNSERPLKEQPLHTVFASLIDLLRRSNEEPSASRGATSGRVGPPNPARASKEPSSQPPPCRP